MSAIVNLEHQLKKILRATLEAIETGNWRSDYPKIKFINKLSVKDILFFNSTGIERDKRFIITEINKSSRVVYVQTIGWQTQMKTGFSFEDSIWLTAMRIGKYNPFLYYLTLGFKPCW